MNEPSARPVVGPVGICGGIRSGGSSRHGHEGKLGPRTCLPSSDPGRAQGCGSASSRSPGSPRAEVHSLHLVMAGLLLALLGAFTYLRRPALLCLAVVAALVGPFGSAAPAYGATGVLAVVLLATAEWLLSRSAGSRLLWPPALALLAGVFGVCLALFHVWGDLAALQFLGGGMLLTLPWVPAASAVQLALSGRPTDCDSVATIAVTRTLLSAFRMRVRERSIGTTDVGRTAATLLVRLDELDAQIPRMASSEHCEFRQVLLSAQSLLEAEFVEDALEAVVVGFSVGGGSSPSRVLETLPAGQCRWFARNGVALIHAYHRIVPEHRRRGCRFEPTCSAYLEEALVRHGLLGGLCLGLKRVLRCVPYGDAGLDPVPDPQEKSSPVACGPPAGR